VFSATQIKLTVLLPLVNRLPVRDWLPASPQYGQGKGCSPILQIFFQLSKIKVVFLNVPQKHLERSRFLSCGAALRFLLHLVIFST
jgi:hypothetical protein